MITGTELLEALPVAVYITEAEGRLTSYNRAAAELWGHNPKLGTSQSVSYTHLTLPTN